MRLVEEYPINPTRQAFPLKSPNPPTILSGGGGSPLPKAEADMSQNELNAKWEAERLKELGVT